MLKSFCDVCAQPLLHPSYDFERQFTSLMGPGVAKELVVQVLISGSRPATHCCDGCFLMLLQKTRVRKHTEVSEERKMTNEMTPTDIDVLRRNYAAAVDALAWAFLYCKLGKTPPTTPLRELFSADELKLTGADPATPVGDVLPREELVEACRDTCARAAGLLDILDVELETRSGDLRPKPAVENVVSATWRSCAT